MSDVSVSRQPLRGMISLRGDLSSDALRGACKTVTGAEIPDMRGATLAGEGGIAWMSPDELLLLTPIDAVPSAIGQLSDSLSGTHHMATDLSDARAVFRLSGSGWREVVARLSPADAAPAALPPGTMRRTRLAQVAAAIWVRSETEAEVFCFASVADYVEGLLQNAAASGTVGFYG
ncbi:sarcosine oxidase subunit gamma [Pelagovum pacificum]|uniref:Sarcosine oxidase subunit gamma n=1 Tax=Pelagovum pacificum TaxID=2588711 RepID=A0A5C5GCP8_9RHOB|nr:sarcosine oxidase subunit gamma family protein [Pelagovum pacificum]QQA41267.1 sarcosine oxidase subunit gamma [Pelagovum pacificum]TNY31924.1 sarcosine oxidase subunit gamma [Pelagovum pacificum]